MLMVISSSSSGTLVLVPDSGSVAGVRLRPGLFSLASRHLVPHVVPLQARAGCGSCPRCPGRRCRSHGQVSRCRAYSLRPAIEQLLGENPARLLALGRRRWRGLRRPPSCVAAVSVPCVDGADFGRKSWCASPNIVDISADVFPFLKALFACLKIRLFLASFPSCNSVFLSQQISRNSVLASFSSEANGAEGSVGAPLLPSRSSRRSASFVLCLFVLHATLRFGLSSSGLVLPQSIASL